MKHVLCMDWTEDNEACAVYGCGLKTIKHVLCMDVDCRQ